MGGSNFKWRQLGLQCPSGWITVNGCWLQRWMPRRRCSDPLGAARDSLRSSCRYHPEEGGLPRGQKPRGWAVGESSWNCHQAGVVAQVDAFGMGMLRGPRSRPHRSCLGKHMLLSASRRQFRRRKGPVSGIYFEMTGNERILTRFQGILYCMVTTSDRSLIDLWQVTVWRNLAVSFFSRRVQAVICLCFLEALPIHLNSTKRETNAYPKQQFKRKSPPDNCQDPTRLRANISRPPTKFRPRQPQRTRPSCRT